MTQATVLLSTLALLLLYLAWRQGDGKLQQGLILAWKTFTRTIPLLIIAFIILGFVNVLAPQELVRTWIGPDSGLKGLLISTGAGMLLPGGPYVVFPLIAALFNAGAGLGPTLTMITSWATLALLTVTFELPFLGWRFSIVRLGLGFMIPPVVGLLGAALFGG